MLGLLWMNASMARNPLRFWTGGWDVWPISLSLSICFLQIINFTFTCLVVECSNFKKIEIRKGEVPYSSIKQIIIIINLFLES